MYTIIFDTGGNAILMTPYYCHLYDNMEQLADDVFYLRCGGTTQAWDDNQPEFRREPHWSDIIVTSDMVAEGRYPPTSAEAVGKFLAHFTS